MNKSFLQATKQKPDFFLHARHIILTVTTDISYDQRMIRICNSLSQAGFKITLIGCKLKNSIPLSPQSFQQKRINVFFEKGKLFYAEYNIRLFIYLLFKKMDCICAIDLDTIIPCYIISTIKNIKRVYDAHELFCEMKEIVTRPAIYKMWKRIERYTVPKFKSGYTVNEPIAQELKKMYGVDYAVVRNISVLQPMPEKSLGEKFILYQGAVNEGRCFETLIPAMLMVDCKLIICGNGNFMEQAQNLVMQHALADKVQFKGKILPDDLRVITAQACIGITLFENKGLSNYYSLANRFFDYLHAGVPQLCVNYPVYKSINDQCPIAVLINDTSVKNLALQLNNLLQNKVLYKRLQHNCAEAREIFNWQIEEKNLIHFYKNLFAN